MGSTAQACPNVEQDVVKVVDLQRRGTQRDTVQCPRQEYLTQKRNSAQGPGICIEGCRERKRQDARGQKAGGGEGMLVQQLRCLLTPVRGCPVCLTKELFQVRSNTEAIPA